MPEGPLQWQNQHLHSEVSLCVCQFALRSWWINYMLPKSAEGSLAGLVGTVKRKMRTCNHGAYMARQAQPQTVCTHFSMDTHSGAHERTKCEERTPSESEMRLWLKRRRKTQPGSQSSIHAADQMTRLEQDRAQAEVLSMCCLVLWWRGLTKPREDYYCVT